MRCPVCRADDTKVVDSRTAEDGAAIRRRRLCSRCRHRFTTYERVDELPLIVVKRSGQREPFDRVKVAAGVRAAGKGRIDIGGVEAVTTTVEDAVRLQGPEITSAQIGLAVLDALRGLDEVAYLRFASVYKGFDAGADFERELTLLKSSAPKAH